MLFHLTARTVFGARPLTDPKEAWWLWRRLRAHFPGALAVCLMPDHLHLVGDAEPRAASQTLARLLSAARRHRPAQAWGRVAEPSVIADARHLQRQIRYVHLNPCRSGLARDPLAWVWSTHRGVMGTEVNPWVSRARLAKCFRREEKDFDRWFHAYVSSDPSVSVEGSAAPTLSPRVEVPVFPLAAVRVAALSAALWCSPVERRRLVVQLARQQGWRNVRGLPELCELSPRSVRRLGRTMQDASALDAARRCLGDGRLGLTEETLSAILVAPPPRSSFAPRISADAA